ncbi:MAG TPA: hypothetical protein PKD00_07040 [Burkholderiales bacterium]|nr:hypothetical protein [Burkholderiales bacterium]
MKTVKNLRVFFLILIATVSLLRSVGAEAQSGGSLKETLEECFDSTFQSYWFDLGTVELKVFYEDEDGVYTKEVYPVELVNYLTLQERFNTAWNEGRRPYLFSAGNVDLNNRVWIVIDPVNCYVTGYLLPTSYKNSWDMPCPDFSNKNKKSRL